MARNIRIGCQSWGYDDWVTKAAGETVFYPRGTRSNEMLELYSRVFDTIEIDSTVYGPPTEATIRSWYEKTPRGFVFSLKTPRRITHEFPLEPSVYPEMDEFLSQAAGLKEKLGAILIQFPAAFEATKENGAKLRAFLARLPTDLQFAVEFRNPGWFVDWMYEELAERSIAVALVDGKWIDRELMFAGLAKLTGRLAYVRFMGIRDLETFDRVQRPQDAVIEFWSHKLKTLPVENMYIYADNYFEGFAPATANKIKASLKLPVVSPEKLQAQPSLF
jgi:uncharacterized protein YecE (DUF72 family)